MKALSLLWMVCGWLVGLMTGLVLAIAAVLLVPFVIAPLHLVRWLFRP